MQLHDHSIIRTMAQQHKANALIHEKSPYLQQHAHNPVDWMAWGEEAFRKAREENKPIFLSSGYSTCHWCHVMERESFENEDIADLLNRLCIPVKLDREERPDIDRLYMTYVQASTGQGGWPMSVWLTPELKPFYGGGYFPPEDRYGIAGFRSILIALGQAWQQERKQIEYVAGSMMQQLKDLSSADSGTEQPDREMLHRAVEELTASFDPVSGGFGHAPKFPRPSVFTFLFSYSYHTGDDTASSMALFTLERMAEGGIHDQLSTPGQGGGGFCRYATDSAWQVPHFEKMLYDNAQLASAYLEAFQVSGNPAHAATARDIFNYLLHDMTSPEGAFYAAEDADSKPRNDAASTREGAFYTWSAGEINDTLPPAEAEAFRYRYGIEEDGNVLSDPHDTFAGRNTLFCRKTIAETAEHLRLTEQRCRELLEHAGQLLFLKRLERPRPSLDDKIITSWNGLTISALAGGYRVLSEDSYRAAAERAANFLLSHMVEHETVTLFRRYREGEAAIEGNADDYAFLAQGLLDLYEATLEQSYLESAIQLTDRQVELFYDSHNGGFYNAASTDSTVPLRLKEDYDGAEPSANSVSVRNLLRLWHATGEPRYRKTAEKTMAYFSGLLSDSASRLPLMLEASSLQLYPFKHVELQGDPHDSRFRALKSVLDTTYRPDTGNGCRSHEQSPGEEGPDPMQPAAYVCIGQRCLAPLTDPEDLDRILARKVDET